MKIMNEHPLYRYLNETEIAELDRARHILNYQPQALVISIGDRSRDILCIDEGEVMVFIECENGQPQEITRMQGGSLIGEMNFVMPTHRTAFVMALSEVKISCYRYHELTAILSENHDLAAKIFAALNLQMTNKLLGLMG